MLEVVNALDPIERIHTCPLKLSEHGKALCPLHRKLDEAIATVEEAFGSATLSQLAPTGPSDVASCQALHLDDKPT